MFEKSFLLRFDCFLSRFAALLPLLCRIALFGLALVGAVVLITCSHHGVQPAYDTPLSLNNGLAGVSEAFAVEVPQNS